MKGKTASESHVHRGQPAALPSVRGARSVSRDAARSTVPGPSTGSGCSERVSGTARAVRKRPTRTTGTFTRNTDRQPVPNTSAAMRTPPRIWPATMDRPAVAPYRPMAFARRRPVVVDWMVARTCGSIAADAAPCATRAATRVQASGARPQASEVRPKAIMPPRNSLRRPKRSPSRPPRTSRTAYASPYPATTSSRSASPAARSWPMVGRATFTMKKSMRGRAAPTSTVKSPSPPSAGGAVAARAVVATERERVPVPVMGTSVVGRSDWYQSVLILVEGLPGNRLRGAAGWRHDHDGADYYDDWGRGTGAGRGGGPGSGGGSGEGWRAARAGGAPARVAQARVRDPAA